ncbi:unnamed protein product, partial [Rotaria magnacalcarata]
EIQQVPSSASLTASSTITESSSNDSGNSLQPTLSLPSSESTLIDPVMETVIDEKSLFIHNENENVQSKTIQSLTSDKRDV